MKKEDIVNFFIPVSIFAVIFMFDKKEVAMYLASVSRVKYYLYKVFKYLINISAVMNSQAFLTMLFQEKILHLIMKQ